MTRLMTVLCLAGWAAPMLAQEPPRAIRQTIPITNSFRAGLKAGTRDSSGHPGPRYWQLRTDYTIAARLDPAEGKVSGRELVVIRNTSDTTLDRVVLRLYQNRFNDRSVRLRPPPSVTPGMQITRLTLNGVPFDLAGAADWGTGTVVTLKLEHPILPGDSGTVEAEWWHIVPDIPVGRPGRARGGRRGSEVLQVAQWYPQVAVFDDLRGWDREEHLGQSEFYNNFGRFDVRLDLPGGWLAGATGVLQNAEDVLSPMVRERLARAITSDEQQVIVAAGERGPGWATAAGDRLVWHFRADLVNDFAWAASDGYVWDATRASIPGLGTIPVNLLYRPERDAYRRTGASARHALEFYSRLWFPYAFPQFTQVDGPEGGMEYPMLTFSGPGFGVTDHEIGHQWWPMMVGTNETWYGWMDEGFNEYMNELSAAAFRDTVPVLDGLGASYGRTAGSEGQAPMMWDNNYGGTSVSYVTYSKAPMMLSMLGALVGDSAVQRAMRAYAQDWKFRHPSPWDFMFSMSRELKAGRSLDWFWYYWLFTTESVDGSIARVEQSGRRTRVTVRQSGEMPAPIVLQVTFAADGPAIRPMKNAVVSGTTATVTWPVEVWFDGARQRTVDLDFGRRRIESIQLDPGGRFPDRDLSDNRWPR